MAAPLKRAGLLGGTADSDAAASRLGITVTMVPAPVILVRDFDNLAARVKSYREPLNRAIRQVMIPGIKERFDSEGGDVGGWEQLTFTTIDIRERDGYAAGPILDRSGIMRRRAVQVNMWTVTQEEAFYSGTPTYYAKYHQKEGGGDSFDMGAPARPFLAMTAAHMDDIEEIFFDWIEERCRLAGFPV